MHPGGAHKLNDLKKNNNQEKKFVLSLVSEMCSLNKNPGCVAPKLSIVHTCRFTSTYSFNIKHIFAPLSSLHVSNFDRWIVVSLAIPPPLLCSLY